ncbi:UvrD-helicase domain-containing protein [Deinococcus sp.]|uniref:UvrD-helicase domain-containing protein n=1 Tax=Deinococcus sp. TaxID=47478 RepID=UPI00391AFFE7
MTISTKPRDRVVLAGAGTGKTHMLADNYLRLLQAHSPLSLVAVTFTERAAAELRARIRTRARGAELSAEVIDQLDAAPIGTIHALAARICRDYPVQAGVPSDFAVMDAQQTQQWVDLHVPLALQLLQPAVMQQIPYSRLLAILRVLLDDPYTHAQQLTTSSPTTAEEGLAQLEAVKQQAWIQLRAQATWQATQATIQQVCGAPGDRLEDCRAQICRVLQGPDEHLAQAVELINSIKLTWGSKKAWSGTDLDVVRGALGELRTLVRSEPLLTLAWNAQDDAMIAGLPALTQAFLQVHEQLFAWRAGQGHLSFADLEGRALVALQHDSIQIQYQRRFAAVLVDECQDISQAQLTLLRAIGEQAEMIFVGDPLQAIYGFRTGRVLITELFQTDLDAQHGDAARLTHSYRAQQGLVEALNVSLHHLTAGQHQSLTAARAAIPDTPPLTFLDVHSKGTRAAQLQAEADAVAAEINTLLTTAGQICDPVDGRFRSVRPSDIALLSRTWRPLDHFQRALLNLGIPAFQAGGGDLLATPEAQDAWILLRAAGDPADDLATSALLRGPLFRLQDAQLYALWEMRLDNEPWQAALLRSRHPDHARARSFFQALRVQQSASPLDSLLLADQFGYRAGLQQHADAPRRTADWDAVLQFIATLEPEYPTSRAAALRLQRMKEGQVRLPRAPLHVADAVTLSSVHQAKGLEWPIVFVVDLGGKPSPDTSPAYMLDKNLVLSSDPFMRTKPALLEYARLQKKRADDEELGHVLYVAATRARDRLYASGPTGSAAPAYTRMSESFQAAGAARESRPHSPEEIPNDTALNASC